jgi:hypothetical protein
MHTPYQLLRHSERVSQDLKASFSFGAQCASARAVGLLLAIPQHSFPDGEIVMSLQSNQQNDVFVHEIRSALTVAKVHVQMLTRRQWPLDPAERDHLISRLMLVDEAMNRAAKHVAKFVETSHRGDDGEQNGSESVHDR